MINVNFGNVSAGVLFSKSRINENGGKVSITWFAIIVNHFNQ